MSEIDYIKETAEYTQQFSEGEIRMSDKLYTDKCFKKLDSLIDHVDCENMQQIKKWGIQSHSAFAWITILVEEVGELAQATLNSEYGQDTKKIVFKEAIQVATLALKIAEMFKEDA